MPRPTPCLKVGLEEDFSFNDMDEGAEANSDWVGRTQSGPIAETGQLVESSLYMLQIETARKQGDPILTIMT